MKSLFLACSLLVVSVMAQANSLGQNDEIFCLGQGNFRVHVGKADSIGSRRMTLVNMPMANGEVYPHGNVVEYVRQCEGPCDPGTILDNGFAYTTYFKLNVDLFTIQIANLTYQLQCRIDKN